MGSGYCARSGVKGGVRGGTVQAQCLSGTWLHQPYGFQTAYYIRYMASPDNREARGRGGIAAVGAREVADVVSVWGGVMGSVACVL